MGGVVGGTVEGVVGGTVGGVVDESADAEASVDRSVGFGLTGRVAMKMIQMTAARRIADTEVMHAISNPFLFDGGLELPPLFCVREAFGCFSEFCVKLLLSEAFGCFSEFCEKLLS